MCVDSGRVYCVCKGEVVEDWNEDRLTATMRVFPGRKMDNHQSSMWDGIMSNWWLIEMSLPV